MRTLNLIPLSNKPVRENDLQVISETGSYVEVKRADSHIVFFDKHDDEFNLNKLLNEVRLSAPPEQVIAYVGLIRGLQISLNYAKKSLPDYRIVLEKRIQSIIKSLNLKHPNSKSEQSIFEGGQV